MSYMRATTKDSLALLKKTHVMIIRQEKAQFKQWSVADKEMNRLRKEREHAVDRDMIKLLESTMDCLRLRMDGMWKITMELSRKKETCYLGIVGKSK